MTVFRGVFFPGVFFPAVGWRWCRFSLVSFFISVRLRFGFVFRWGEGLLDEVICLLHEECYLLMVWLLVMDFTLILGFYFVK